ncbi:MAG: transglutaminase-like domain-containing protein [Longimonas sp.]|uniref:SirB1 family protein n=1 Tax=Longimonas sp. TaxID=2039626 RepID=UPI00336438F7
MPRTASIDALVTLLDDPDAAVQAAVREELATCGPDDLAALRKHIRSLGEAEQEALMDRIQPLHFDMVQRAWHAVLDSDTPDLERGALLLAWYRYPDADLHGCQEQLDAMAASFQNAHPGLSGHRAAMELADYMAHELHFTGNKDDYKDPDNSFLNRVLKRRTGIPISLSVVYLLLAERAGIKAYGVNLPRHFIVKYQDDQHEIFFDPFNDGQPMDRGDCVRFLLKANVQPHPQHFAPAPPRSILLRMARNLLMWAKQHDNIQMQSELMQLMAPYDPSIEASE